MRILRQQALALLFCVVSACLPPAGVRYPGLPTLQDGALHIVVFDMGQADAMLVVYGGKSMLIDAGAARGEPQLAAQRIPRRLDALLGTRHLDYFMLSHYHADHIGSSGGGRKGKDPSGMFALIARQGVTVGTVIDRGDWNLGKKGWTQRSFEEGVRDWLASGAAGSERQARPGDFVDMGKGLEARIVTANGNGQLDRLHALFPDLVRSYEPTENDYSVGIKFTLGNFEMVTAGDLSGRNSLRVFGVHKESYNDMESRVAGDIGAVEIYRVNHHGSRFSSNDCFVQVLSPRVSIVSSGRNTYGHPDPDVYNLLKRYGDVRITGGADSKSQGVVSADIVGGDVDIVVSPDGSHYWVNGVPYTSTSDAEEAARPNSRAACEDTLEQRPRESPYEQPDNGDTGVAD